MIIIGGSYTEICLEPKWENIYGSGLRAANLIAEFDDSEEITFYTCADNEVSQHLRYYESMYENLSINITEIPKSPGFHYDHPLKVPHIFPRPDVITEKKAKISCTDENILIYGLLESDIEINGNRVVYDPQSPANPKPFSNSGGSTNQLVTIINFSEAKRIAKSDSISEIKNFFLKKENCFALILKMGAQGALIFDTSSDDEVIKVPVFKTKKVWPIGSGDIFSAFFAFQWFNGSSISESATLASKATAIYCNTKSLTISNYLEKFDFEELIVDAIPDKQIYLAGPFFTFTERWLVNEVWTIFKGMNLKVFSPFHDVGHGKAEDVVEKDIIGLNESEIVFAILDDLDSGTLFELGYAVAQGKKVIAFVQNESEEALKMLEGTNCIIEKDLTTAIYKTYWELC